MVTDPNVAIVAMMNVAQVRVLALRMKAQTGFGLDLWRRELFKVDEVDNRAWFDGVAPRHV